MGQDSFIENSNGDGRLKSKPAVTRKRSLIFVTFLCVTVFLVAFVAFSSQNSVLATTAWRVEPETARDMDDPPYYKLPRPSIELPISDVLKKGKEIPIQFAYNDPEWKRQAYKSYWHNGRWSYVPIRIHYAMHRLFATYPTASVYYDFVHDLGIALESNDFKIPTSENPFTNIVVVVMQAKVEKIVTLCNQVVIVGEPALTGLQVVLVPVAEIEPCDMDDSILFQLVSDKESEYDNTTLGYITAPPSRQ